MIFNTFYILCIKQLKFRIAPWKYHFTSAVSFSSVSNSFQFYDCAVSFLSIFPRRVPPFISLIYDILMVLVIIIYFPKVRICRRLAPKIEENRVANSLEVIAAANRTQPLRIAAIIQQQEYRTGRKKRSRKS